MARQRGVNVVFAGADLKAIAYGGAIEEFMRRGIKINKVGGDSSGCLAAIILALGYESSEFETIVYETDFTDFAGRLAKAAAKKAGRVPQNLAGRFVKGVEEHYVFELIRRKYGIGDAGQVEKWLADLCKNKGYSPNLTFADLKMDMRLLAFDLNERKGIVFSKYHTPNASVIEAILSSMALFPVFKLRQWYDEYGRLHLLADGGFWDTCPMDIFDNPKSACKEKDGSTITIGLRPVTKGFSSKSVYREIKSILEVFNSFSGLAIENQQFRHIKERHWHRVIDIPTDLQHFDFLIYGNDIRKKKQLWEIGRKTAADYLDIWGNVMFWRQPWKGLVESIIKIKLRLSEKYA